MNNKFFIALFLLSSILTFGQSGNFSKNEVLEDYNTLYNSLKETHYNLYAYTSEEEFDAAYNDVKDRIKKDSFNLLEVTNLYQQLISTAKNGHTEISFPGQAYGEYAYSGGTLFPLELAFENDKALVRKNWSEDTGIAIGSQVLSVNGQSIAEMMKKIYPQVSAERTYFKNAKIEFFSFPRLYWQVFGKQDEFEVEISVNGELKKHNLKAIDLIEGYEMKREEVLNAKMKLEFLKRAAYLNPGDFSGDEDKFRKFIDSAFVEIIKNKSENLIVDLRNNRGGNDSFSDYMVSYIADKPFKWNSKFTLKTSQFLKDHVRQNNDTTEVYWQEVLNRKNGEIYDYEFETYQPQPSEKRYNGMVYVLVNRQSHSQSAVTASQIQDYGFGTIVGEETGDYPSLYASQFHYTLPHTGIAVAVSKGYIVRVNGSTREEGVIPDIYIQDHLLDDEDEILEGLLERLD